MRDALSDPKPVCRTCRSPVAYWCQRIVANFRRRRRSFAIGCGGTHPESGLAQHQRVHNTDSGVRIRDGTCIVLGLREQHGIHVMFSPMRKRVDCLNQHLTEIRQCVLHRDGDGGKDTA